MASVQPSEWYIDIAYGNTPESALFSVIKQHDSFNTRVCEYIGERPNFMSVKPSRRGEHDWSQYENKQSIGRGGKGGPIKMSRKVAYDLVPEDNEQRMRITLDNVWVKLGYGDFHDDELAEVAFCFSLQMRESAWEGKDEPRPGDLHWKCERMSTEPVN